MAAYIFLGLGLACFALGFTPWIQRMKGSIHISHGRPNRWSAASFLSGIVWFFLMLALAFF